MALSFTNNSTNNVSHGVPGSPINNLSQWSWCAWLKFSSFTAFNNIMGDPSGTGQSTKIIYLNGASGNELDVYVGETTKNTDYVSSGAGLVAGTWYFIAATADITLGTGLKIHIYSGTLTSAVAELSYGAVSEGSGVLRTPDGAYRIGAQSGSDCAGFTMAWHGLWNRVLTLGEIRQQQFRQVPASGCVLFAHYGFGVTAGSSQPDLSGSGFPGTVTGATIADHAPLAPQFWEFTWEGGGLLYPTDTSAVSWHFPKTTRPRPFAPGLAR